MTSINAASIFQGQFNRALENLGKDSACLVQEGKEIVGGLCKWIEKIKSRGDKRETFRNIARVFSRFPGMVLGHLSKEQKIVIEMLASGGCEPNFKVREIFKNPKTGSIEATLYGDYKDQLTLLELRIDPNTGEITVIDQSANKNKFESNGVKINKENLANQTLYEKILDYAT